MSPSDTSCEAGPFRTSRRNMLAGVYVLGVGALSGCAAPGAAPITTSPLAVPPATSGPSAAVNPVSIRYGMDSERQFGDLFLPPSTHSDAPLPVLVTVHGGGWRAVSTLDYWEPVCRQIAAQGVAVWNIEYRGVGGGGGWPTTFEDVAAAVDAVAELSQHTTRALDVSRAHITGHSAGGQLAAWVASRPVLPASAPGAHPAVEVRSCVSLAGVYDLVLAEKSGDPFMRPLLDGSPTEVPDRYRLASPIDHLPTGIPVVCLHGQNDRTVKVAQAWAYTAAARAAGDPVEAVILPRASHGSWMDTRSAAWRVARRKILHHVLNT